MAKMIMTFPYQLCIAWLRKEAAKLTTLGYSVEIKENAKPLGSLLLRITAQKTLAELVVWENGTTSMIVINLDSDHYDLDRHNIVLTEDRYKQDLEAFFNHLK
jgi:hypothetical protein